jgi:pimeloyl-ACP methyl ester carboxylesterase
MVAVVDAEPSVQNDRNRPRRRRFRRVITGLGSITVVLVAVLLFLAYAWQPGASGYASKYLDRVDSRYVETSVARFHYTKTGQGSPVVLVAGGGQWLFSYRDTVPALAEHHTVYAVDLPGQGYTDLHQAGFDYGLDAMAAALGSFMDAVGLPRASIVGHSWGGSWTLYFAEIHPERVERLALIDATGLDVPSNWDWRPLEFPVIGELIGKLMGRRDAARTLRKAFVHQERVTDEVVDEDWAPMSRPENRRALWLSQRNLDYSLTQRLLGRVQAPTLILWGSEDKWDNVSEAAEFARRIPGATPLVLQDCGHNAHEDCPDRTNPPLSAFLDGTPTA